MQQEDRCQTERLALSHRWNVHHNWGLRRIEWDPESFKSGRLEITRLQARMRDGTLIDVPGDGRLPTLELAEILANRERVTVYVALAQLHDKGPNSSTPQPVDPKQPEQAAAAKTRYLTEKFEIADENDGADLQTLEFRILNLQLLLDTQDLAGYEVLEIGASRKVRLRKARARRCQLHPAGAGVRRVEAARR